MVCVRKLRIFGIVISLALVFAVSASALTTVFTSKAVSSAGVTVTQTECVNSDGTTVSAIWYLYNTSGDYSSKTLRGAEAGTLKPTSSAYYGKNHSLYYEKGSGVTLTYKYTIN
jgi:hypothetical protein